MRDWTATPDDPSGYSKMRSFLLDASERLEALEIPTANQMGTAADWVGSRSEWLGESARAL